VVTGAGAAVKVARRINPVPVDSVAAPESAAQAAEAGNSSSSNSVARKVDAASYTSVGRAYESAAAAVTDSTEIQAVLAADAMTHVDVAAAAEEAEAAVEPAAAGRDSIVEALMGLCISSSRSSNIAEVARNAASTPADNLEFQHAVAAAVGQRDIEQAVGVYIAAAEQILPGGPPADAVINSSSSNVAAAWRRVVDAAVSTADVLVAGVAAGCYTASDLEQQLLESITPRLASHTSADTAALSSPAAATRKQVSAVALVTDSSAQQQQEQQQLCQLLAGAVMHALLTNSKQKLTVWSGDIYTGCWISTGSSSSSSSSMPHLVRLPAALMKVARDDGPLWLLQQLRTWLQAATLGNHGGNPWLYA
jgi:hypothetical protein